MALTRTVNLSRELDLAVQRYAAVAHLSASEIHRRALTSWEPLRAMLDNPDAPASLPEDRAQ
jgi:hypothetical protein